MCYKYSMEKLNIDIKLKKLRKEKGVSQGTVAIALRITPSAYSNYEQGLRIPTIPILIKLCKFFNVTSDYLLGLED